MQRFSNNGGQGQLPNNLSMHALRRKSDFAMETAEVARTAPTQSGCCGGDAPHGVNACCLEDADAKKSGEDGCGCKSKASVVGAGEGQSITNCCS